MRFHHLGYAREDGSRVIRSWVWEKIPMRTEMERSSGEPTVMEVTRVELDVPIPADRFAVPADVVITDPGTSLPGSHPSIPSSLRRAAPLDLRQGRGAAGETPHLDPS